ncbi:MAG: hypothetical protein AAF990_21945 [Bacteroidota bacterium]
MKNLDEDLKNAFDQKLLKEKIETHIAGVQQKLDERSKELRELLEKFEGSQTRLEDLESFSLRNLFVKILGNEKQQFDRERQNCLMYALRIKEIKERIESKKFEINVLKEKLITLSGVEEAYEKLLRDKKSQLKFRNKELSKVIISVEMKIRKLASQQREIKEAIATGNKTLGCLEELDAGMKVIKNWGAKIGVKEFQYLIYHERKYVKSLLTNVRKVNASLDNFIDELNDVSSQYKLDYSQFIKNISRFLENFYDGLISDWIIHKELKVAMNLLIETTDKVRRLIEMLHFDLEKTAEQEQGVHRQLEEILVNNKIP